jgi:hypothetical protein
MARLFRRSGYAGKPDAPARNRTWNLRIKSPLLCQLSYRGAGAACARRLRLGGVELALEALAHVRVGEVERLAAGEVARARLAGLVGEDGQLRVGARAVARAREDLLGARRLHALAEHGVGLDHEAGHAVVRLLRQIDVLVPRVTRGAQPPASVGRVRAGLLVEVVARVGEVEARAGELGPGCRSFRVRAGAAGGRALAVLEPLRRAVAAARRPRDRVDQAAGHRAADPEQDQAAAHQQGERHVDDLYGAATAGASEVEEHGAVRGVTAPARPRPPRRGRRPHGRVCAPHDGRAGSPTG